MNSQFSSELQRGISDAQDASITATEAGHPYEAYLYRARLVELLDLAGEHGIEVGALVRPAIRAALADDQAAVGG